MLFNVANLGSVATGPLATTLAGAVTDFHITQSTCLLLAPQAVCVVSVVFSPTASSPTTQKVTLTIVDTDVGGSAVSASLTGTAYPAYPLTITSGQSDLGQVLIGTTGASEVFSVSYAGNTPSGPLVVSLSSTELVLTSDTCSGTSLASGGGCNVSIALKPTTVGAKAATLSVVGTSGAPAIKALTGTGISASDPLASPATVDFGSISVNSTTAAQTMTIINRGGSPTGVLILSKSGDVGEFVLTKNSCSSVLLPAGSCSFSIAFAPTTSGAHSATFAVTDGAVRVTVPVTGQALM
jgi:hypothetical protein